MRKMCFPRCVVLVGCVFLLLFCPVQTRAQKKADNFSYDHVILLILENKSESILHEAPELGEMAREGLLARKYYGIGRPSQPNYLALLSGSAYGIQDNLPHDLNAPTLVDQLEAANVKWKAYMEDIPERGWLGVRSSNGLYARKHNPFVSFTSITSRPERLQRIVPFIKFSRDLENNTLPEFVWITPNLCHDMHDAPGCETKEQAIASGNTFVKETVKQIMDSIMWYTTRSILIITFDEGARINQGSDLDKHGGQMPLIALDSQDSLHGVLDTPSNHYGLLRWIEQNWDLGCLEEACKVEPLAIPTR